MRRHGRSVGVGCHRAEQSGLECNIKRGTGTGAAHPVCLFFWGATRSQPLTERKSPPCPPNQPARTSTYVAIGIIRAGRGIRSGAASPWLRSEATHARPAWHDGRAPCIRSGREPSHELAILFFGYTPPRFLPVGVPNSGVTWSCRAPWSS